MTVDDDNSIYVGGLPYSATEDSVRKVFSLYGSIVAVKIINDRGTRGKCYGFVTFRNPRSVTDAISDMDGKTMEGRVLRVNGVTSRGGRSNLGRERFGRDMERSMDWDRGRDRQRDHGRDRSRYRDHYSNRSRERDRSWDRAEERETGFERAGDHDRVRDSFLEREQSQDTDLVDNEQEQGRKSDWSGGRSRDADWDQDREMDGTNEDRQVVQKDTEQHSRKQNGSTYVDYHGHENSSGSSDDYGDEVKIELKRSIQTRDELRNEISQMEERLDVNQQLISELQQRAKKLEDELVAAKKHSSQRKTQLSKLHKCFLQVKDYTERLKSSEQELQSLVDSAMIEGHISDDVRIRDAVLINGKA